MTEIARPKWKHSCHKDVRTFVLQTHTQIAAMFLWKLNSNTYTIWRSPSGSPIRLTMFDRKDAASEFDNQEKKWARICRIQCTVAPDFIFN